MPRHPAALALLLAACEREPGPLDVETLQALARHQGDAQGDAFAGDYLIVGERIGCDCPTVMNIDLCTVLGLGAPAIPTQIFQQDGLLVLDLAATVSYVGGVDQGGEFAVAAIIDASLVAASGEIHSRIDGEFADSGFTGTLQNRLVGTYVGEDVDCQAKVAVDATGLP